MELPSMPLQSRYSVTKFLALQEYLGKATPWRTLCVLVSIPLSALVVAVLPAFLPAAASTRRPTWGFLLHGWIMILAVSSGNMLSWIAVAQTSPRYSPTIYSAREALVVGVCCATFQAGAVTLIYEFVCFPVPFIFVSCFGLWVTNLFLANVVVLLSKCYVHRAVLLASLKINTPYWCVQMTQIAINPTFSTAFDRMSEPYQILLTLLFPIIKRLVRYVVKKLARRLRDHSGVVSVSSVEICASVYQSMIMQSAPSQIAAALIMGIDLVQGLFSIKLLMDKPTAPRPLTGAGSCPAACAVGRRGKRGSVRGSLRGSQRGSDHKASVRGSFEDAFNAARVSTSSTQKAVMGHALMLAQTAETLLLLPSAQFNPHLAKLHTNQRLRHHALNSIALYSALQTVSYVAMHVVMKYRYGISATLHLAFVLERHRQSIVGKMVASLPVTFYFKAVHYGTDFSFKFDFDSYH